MIAVSGGGRSASPTWVPRSTDSDQRESTGMTPTAAPKAARALLAAVAGGVLLAGCGLGGAGAREAAAVLPTTSAVRTPTTVPTDSTAPAAAPVVRASAPRS